MKNYTILITLLLLFATPQIKAEKPTVVATASMFSDMAKNIVGNKMDVQLLVPVGADPHTHKPTPGDAKMVVNADLVLQNALGFEGWLGELIKHSGTKATIATITEGIKPLMSESYDSPDPHAWMDGRNGLKYIENIKNAVVALDPANKDFYEKNYSAYRIEIKEMDEYIQQEINKIPLAKRILITSHDAFKYYGKRYGVQLESTMGVSTEAEPTPEDVQNLIKVIKGAEVPAIFAETTINPKIMKQIAADANIVLGGSLYADSIGLPGEDGDSYIKMMTSNTDKIVAGLTGKIKESVITDESSGGFGWATILIGLLLVGAMIFMFSKMNR